MTPKASSCLQPGRGAQPPRCRRRAPFPGGAAAARTPLLAPWERRAALGWAPPRAGCTCAVRNMLQDLLVGHELHLQGAAALPLRLAHGGHPASTPASATWAPPGLVETVLRLTAPPSGGPGPRNSGLGLLPPLLPAPPRAPGRPLRRWQQEAEARSRARQRATPPPSLKASGACTDGRRRALTDLCLGQSATLVYVSPPAGGSSERAGLPLPAKRAPAGREPGVAVATRSRRERRAVTARPRPPPEAEPPSRPAAGPALPPLLEKRSADGSYGELARSPRWLLSASHPTHSRVCRRLSYETLEMHPALDTPSM